ncbi:MAG TPA: hypothetical protein VHO69_08630 [Phototrophicaceae bacterium]|nr:hypothetical protein [Phototrophicaceae bacterium]
MENIPSNLKLTDSKNESVIWGRGHKVYGEKATEKNFMLRDMDFSEYSNNEKKNSSIFVSLTILLLYLTLLLVITNGLSPNSVSRAELPFLYLLCIFAPVVPISLIRILYFGTSGYFSNQILQRRVFVDLTNNGILVIGKVKMVVPINESEFEIHYCYPTTGNDLLFDKYRIFKKIEINPTDSVAVLSLDGKISILL